LAIQNQIESYIQNYEYFAFSIDIFVFHHNLPSCFSASTFYMKYLRALSILSNLPL